MPLPLSLSVIGLNISSIEAIGGFVDGGNTNAQNLSAGSKDAFDMALLVNNVEVLKIKSGAPANSFYIDAAGKVGFGTVAPDQLLHVEASTALTNIVQVAARLSHITSGTPANDIGVGLEFEVETAAGNNEVVGGIEGIAIDVSPASEDGALVFRTMKAGAPSTEDARFQAGKLFMGSSALSGGAGTLTLDTGVATTHLLLSIATIARMQIKVSDSLGGVVDLYNTSGSVKTRMVGLGTSFFDGGNVGIGTTTPQNLLDVDGAVVIGSAYAGVETAPVNGLLIEGNVGIGIAAPTTPLHVDSNDANTAAILTLENTAGNFQIFRVDADPEGVVTGSIGDIVIDTVAGTIHIKGSGTATNTGWIVVGGTGKDTYKSYSFANPGNAGTFYIGGSYSFSATDVTLTIGGTVIQTFGTAGQARGAHFFVVASGAGGTDLVLTLTGVSITDAGVKNDSDSEVLVPDTDAVITDQYLQSTKKWLGQVTATLTGSSGAFTFNYGFADFESFGHHDFTLIDFDATGKARANETGFNIELLHHKPSAFTYSAGAFAPNATPLISSGTDYGTNNDVASGDNFKYTRTGMSTAVAGGSEEGLIIRVTTVVNNSINDASFHIGVVLT